MVWLLWFCVVVVLGLGAVVASGRLGQLPPTQRDQPYPDLPDGDLTATDIARVEFATVARGYSPDQVEELLARVCWQLDPWGPPGKGSPESMVRSAIMVPETSAEQPKEG
ncbi:MAG: DivIVA domain-containing protein [Propioniciclava sp.]